MNEERSSALHAAIHRGNLAEVHRLAAESLVADGRDPAGRPALVVAAALGHADIVSALLAAGAAVDALSEEPEEEPPPHPEMVAAQADLEKAIAKCDATEEAGLGLSSAEGRSGLMEVLDAAMRKFNAAHAAWEIPDEHGGESALIAASRCGNRAVVRILLDHGARIESADSEIPSALSDAAENGHLEIVRMLLAAGAEVDSLCFSTPLMEAAENGHVEVVRTLLADGADLHKTTAGGGTGLMAAARGGDLETVRTLVEAGAGVNARSYREAALHKAAKAGHREVYEYLEPMSAEEIRQTAHPLLQKGIEQKKLHESFDSEDLAEAIEDDDLEGIHQLIDRGVNVDVRDPSGQTPLMLASLYGKTAIVEALLAAGANPNLTSEIEGLEHGATALMMAAESPFAQDRPRLIAALIAAGADPDTRDTEQGWTALMRAVLTRGGLVDSVKALLAAGADLGIRDHEGNTALMMAREAADARVARLLEAARPGVCNR